MGWVTIPGTVVAVGGVSFLQQLLTENVQTFIFFGFLVAGEEIESAYNYP